MTSTMNYDDALVVAISKNDLARLVEKNKKVTIYKVYGLGERLFLDEIEVDENTIIDRENNSLGPQFWYHRRSTITGEMLTLRAFYEDCGMLFKKCNRHLTFFDKSAADAYLLWQKTDPDEIRRDREFMIRFNRFSSWM